MTLRATVKAEILPYYRGGNDYDTGGLISPVFRALLSLTNGTAANQADLMFVDERTVSESSNDDLDLAGSLVDSFGTTLTFAELVALMIVNAPIAGAANVSDLTIGNGSNPFEGFLGGTNPVVGPIKPGAMFLIAAGDAAGIGTVTGGSADELRIANGAGGSATYQIMVLGRSA